MDTAAATRILHGKEGVDGSSPSEGLKYLQIGYFCCLISRSPAVRHGGGHLHVDLQGLSRPPRFTRGYEGTVREHERAEQPSTIGRSVCAKALGGKRRSPVPGCVEIRHRAGSACFRAVSRCIREHSLIPANSLAGEPRHQRPGYAQSHDQRELA